MWPHGWKVRIRRPEENPLNLRSVVYRAIFNLKKSKKYFTALDLEIKSGLGSSTGQ